MIRIEKESTMHIVSKFVLTFLLSGPALLTLCAPLSARAGGLFDCEPIEVIERSNRIGVECQNSFPVGFDILAIDWIKFVTFPKTDVAQMERFMDVAMRALIEGKYFRVEVPDDDAGNLNGCLPENCRTVTTPFSIRER
jgi:hypothetical protein